VSPLQAESRHEPTHGWIPSSASSYGTFNCVDVVSNNDNSVSIITEEFLENAEFRGGQKTAAYITRLR